MALAEEYFWELAKSADTLNPETSFLAAALPLLRYDPTQDGGIPRAVIDLCAEYLEWRREELNGGAAFDAICETEFTALCLWLKSLEANTQPPLEKEKHDALLMVELMEYGYLEMSQSLIAAQSRERTLSALLSLAEPPRLPVGIYHQHGSRRTPSHAVLCAEAIRLAVGSSDMHSLERHLALFESIAPHALWDTDKSNAVDEILLVLDSMSQELPKPPVDTSPAVQDAALIHSSVKKHFYELFRTTPEAARDFAQCHYPVVMGRVRSRLPRTLQDPWNDKKEHELLSVAKHFGNPLSDGDITRFLEVLYREPVKTLIESGAAWGTLGVISDLPKVLKRFSGIYPNHLGHYRAIFNLLDEALENTPVPHKASDALPSALALRGTVVQIVRSVSSQGARKVFDDSSLCRKLRVEYVEALFYGNQKWIESLTH